jgi:hypothetical protein
MHGLEAIENALSKTLCYRSSVSYYVQYIIFSEMSYLFALIAVLHHRYIFHVNMLWLTLFTIIIEAQFLQRGMTGGLGLIRESFGRLSYPHSGGVVIRDK